MPRVAKVLSALQVKRLTKPGFHAVGNPVDGITGLLLQVTKTGARSWVLRYTIGGKRREMGLGSYPKVTLAEAREAAQKKHKLIMDFLDPIEERKAKKGALAARANPITFADAARQCHDVNAPTFKNQKHRAQWINTLETYAFPLIGKLPVSDIDTAHVLQVLQPIWKTKTETATRLRQRMETVFGWAIAAKHRATLNPARWSDNLKPLLTNPSSLKDRKHHPALPWMNIGAFVLELRKLDGLGARALEFVILTAARSGEVRGATWDEINLDSKTWTIPAERMKSKKGGLKHTVPLCSDAVKLLKHLPRMEGTDLVFPSARGKALSDMTLSATIKRMHADSLKTGWKGYIDPDQNNRVIVPHGFRSSFKDWARSSTRHADEVSELALAHVNSDKTRAAYARDELLPQRTKLMQDWARFINTAPVTKGATVTPIRGKKNG